MKEINYRRSIRQYTEKKVTQEQITKLLKAAMQAPSAANQQPWEFIVVEDKESLVKVSEMSPYSGMVKEASVAFILLANENQMKFPENWQQDMSAATQNLLLEVASLELGAVWLGVAPLKERMGYLSELFKLPSYIKPFAVVPVGHPVNENQFIDRYDEARVHKEIYVAKDK